MSVISVVIKHWNKQIYTLSFILERFINLFIYMLNGYINVLSLILSEIKVVLKFSLLALKYNPFVIVSTFVIPIVNEFLVFNRKVSLPFGGGSISLVKEHYFWKWKVFFAHGLKLLY